MYAKEIITDPRIVRFWEKTIQNGTHLTPPPKFNPECWDWRLSVSLEYVFTNRTLREIAEDYQISYEYVRKIAQKTTRQMWERSSRSTKRCYPLYKLNVRRISASEDIAA